MFAVIKYIILPELSSPKFVVNTLVTNTFSKHYHAYEVSHHNSIVVCSQSDLPDFNVLGLYQSYSCASVFYVPLRYHVLSDYD